MVYVHMWITTCIAIIASFQVNVQGNKSIERRFMPPLEPGDSVVLRGIGRAKSVGLIRLHSRTSSCSTEPQSDRVITCNPLVMKLRTRKHQIAFLTRDMENNNKDRFLKLTKFPQLANGDAYTLMVTVTDDGFDVSFNNQTISINSNGISGKPVMMRATSGNYLDITVKRKTPLNEHGCGFRGTDLFTSKFARITNGQTADPGAYPWQVALRRRIVYPWAPYAHMCGGTLIRKCWVLTAGHCVQYVKRRKQNYVIRVGDLHNGDDSEHSEEEKQDTFDIEEVIIHPNFTDRPVPKHDIALIKLVPKDGECAQYGEFVNSVCLPEPFVDTFKDNTLCHITGWGAKNWTDRPRDYPHMLQFGRIKLQNYDTCRKLYGKHQNSADNQISEGMLCAGSPGIDTCQGDSGGPLVCQKAETFGEPSPPFILWGVTSWGHGCADSTKPGVYANVAHYLNWIVSTMRNY